MYEKANSKLIKTLNEIRLLNLIREVGPISRNELARRSQISKVAVSDIINRLNEAGFILEIGKGKSTSKGGKRPTLLKLNPDNGYVIGIEIKRRTTIIALANLESEIKSTARLKYPIGASIDMVVPEIFRKIESLFKKHHYDLDKLISIGIGIPGFVEYSKGELSFADTLQGWANLPLASRFLEHFNVPIIIENDVNTITLGESLIGAGRGKSNLVCIWLGEGIGAGIIVDQRLVRGETGTAGEIGYLELGYYLQNNASIRHLYSEQRYFGEILSEVNLLEALTCLKLTSKSNGSELAVLEALLAEGDHGNQSVQKVLDEYAYLLAIICTNFIKTINPSLIILCGRVIDHSNYLVNKVRELVKHNMRHIPFQSSSITVSELKKEAGVKGAIALALQTIFEPPVTRRKNVTNHRIIKNL